MNIITIIISMNLIARKILWIFGILNWDIYIYIKLLILILIVNEIIIVINVCRHMLTAIKHHIACD
jgi:hypothetical protein